MNLSGTVYNTAQYGGGIYFDSTATIDITGGTISKNEAVNGGGIYDNSTGTENSVKGCVITGNKASSGGGGINHNGNGTLSIGGSNDSDSVTISDNTAGNEGGGICTGDTLTITNSAVLGNSAVVRGGGIMNYNTLTIDGGTVWGNKVTGNDGKGGGILNPSNLFTLKNSPVIYNNTDKNDNANNVYLANGKTITIDSSFGTDSVIGVTMETPGEFVTSDITNAKLHCFFSDKDDFEVKIFGDPYSSKARIGFSPGARYGYMFTETASLPTDAGSYILTGDVTLDNGVELEGVTNLDLNGHTVTVNTNNYIKVNCTLNLFDSSTGRTGKISFSYGKVAVSGEPDNAVFNMFGGKITGNTSNMLVSIATKNTFSMFSGEISGNTNSYDNGGGVGNYYGTNTLPLKV